LGKKEGTSEKINEIIKQGDIDNDGKSKLSKPPKMTFCEYLSDWLIHALSSVSYPEFLEMFRKETNSLVQSCVKAESTMGDDEESLLGIDTKIPGGKYDSSERAKQGL
jgi:hypothetical protein